MIFVFNLNPHFYIGARVADQVFIYYYWTKRFLFFFVLFLGTRHHHQITSPQSNQKYNLTHYTNQIKN